MVQEKWHFEQKSQILRQPPRITRTKTRETETGKTWYFIPEQCQMLFTGTYKDPVIHDPEP
jgi:hypothetical protein